MLKLTVLYTQPDDADAFEQHYAAVHMPLVHEIPGLVRAEVARVVGTPDGSPPPYYRITELYFEDQHSLGAGMGSEPGRASGKDAAELVARTGATISVLVSAVD